MPFIGQLWCRKPLFDDNACDICGQFYQEHLILVLSEWLSAHPCRVHFKLKSWNTTTANSSIACVDLTSFHGHSDYLLLHFAMTASCFFLYVCGAVSDSIPLISRTLLTLHMVLYVIYTCNQPNGITRHLVHLYDISVIHLYRHSFVLFSFCFHLVIGW